MKARPHAGFTLKLGPRFHPLTKKKASAARTLALLGATIKNFESNENGTLALTFSNGHRLTMLDPSKEYESYDITRPGQTIIV